MQMELEYAFEMGQSNQRLQSRVGTVSSGSKAEPKAVPRRRPSNNCKGRLLTCYEFFAGGGMARLGLGEKWQCVFANEWSVQKAKIYRLNFPSEPDVLAVCDVASLEPENLPGCVDMAWASFPCQDLSLAGNGAGLAGSRSGTFHQFWRLIEGLQSKGRAPKVVVLENVAGTLTSHGGEDFKRLIQTVSDGGYRVGAIAIDAVHFLPQSRPRLFWVALRQDLVVPTQLERSGPSRNWHSSGLVSAYSRMSKELQDRWIWWKLPDSKPRSISLLDLLENDNEGVQYHDASETQKLVSMMSKANLAKLEMMKSSGEKQVATLYRRTRAEQTTGTKMQRAELRIDGIAGCLRTPGGGSSRQILVVVENGIIKTRLLTSREAARLMGIPDSYVLPHRYNDAYHLIGDGLAVPAVSWLAEKLLEPLVANCMIQSDVSAA